MSAVFLVVGSTTAAELAGKFKGPVDFKHLSHRRPKTTTTDERKLSPRACVMGHDIMIVLDATTITSGFMHECAPRSVTRNPFSCSSATLYCSYEDALLEVVEAIFFARLHARPRESRVFVRGCEGMPCAFWRALRVILSDRLCVRELTIIPAPPLPLHSTEQVTGLDETLACSRTPSGAHVRQRM